MVGIAKTWLYFMGTVEVVYLADNNHRLTNIKFGGLAKDCLRSFNSQCHISGDFSLAIQEKLNYRQMYHLHGTKQQVKCNLCKVSIFNPAASILYVCKFSWCL